MPNSKFFNIIGNKLDLECVVRAIYDFVNLKPQRKYEIIVATDSAARSDVSFVTAITVWRIGNGGIHFWTRSEKTHCHDMRERIYKEKLGDEFFWNDQIHIDVGENGPTKDFIETVVGMVKGYGFDAVIKPYSFGASIVADRHT